LGYEVGGRGREAGGRRQEPSKKEAGRSRQEPRKQCCRTLKLRYGILRQFSRKQHFIVPTQTQQTHVQRLSPENKRLHFIYHCKQVTEAKSKAQSTYGCT
jgi:hypothetical protein